MAFKCCGIHFDKSFAKKILDWSIVGINLVCGKCLAKW